MDSTQTSVEWPSLQSEEYNDGRFNEDQMKEVNEALDTNEHVVSLGDCEAVVDEEEEDSEFVDSDYEFSEDEEANKGCNADINMPCDEEHLKEAIKEYAIVNDKLLKFDKNDKRMVKVLCRGSRNYAFVLYASRIDKEESTFVVKAIHVEHTCGRVDRLRYANSAWISQRFCDKMRRNPNWTVGQLQDEEQYERLRDDAEQIKKTNPGSTVVNKTELACEDALFERIYICLASSKKGFLEGCRPVVGVDGCHLKGPCLGQILTVVGVDGNNDLGIQNGLAWVFISDKQKGLILAMQTVLPNTEHRMSMRHLYNNFRGQHTGLALKHLLWAAARATTLPWWEAKMDDMKEDLDSLGNEDIEDNVDKLYKKEGYLKTYGPIIGPVPSIDQWPRSSLPAIKPPNFRIQPGRTRKVRTKEPGEVEIPASVPPNPKPPNWKPQPTRLRQFFIKIRCTRCGQEGHNRKGCETVQQMQAKATEGQAPAPQAQTHAPQTQAQRQPQLVAATKGGRGRGRMRGLGRSSSQPQP
ncbi:unnamed protein product [Prunus armeniaca]